MVASLLYLKFSILSTIVLCLYLKSMSEILTAFDAYQLYYRHIELTRPSSLRYTLNTTIVRYTLPGYGIPPGLKIADGINFMKNIPMHQFVDALNIQQKVFESVDLEPQQRRSYRYVLNGFLRWCADQEWWTNATRAKPGEYAPRLRVRKGTACKVRLTNKKAQSAYRLLEHEISDSLKLEFEGLHSFLTSADWENRPDRDDAVGELSFKTYKGGICYALGWLHRHQTPPSQNVPLEQLSLSLLDDIKVIYRYANWLETTRKVLPNTKLIRLCALLNVCKYLHHQECDPDEHYRDVPIVKEIRKLTKKAAKRGETERQKVDMSKKLQTRGDLFHVLQQLEKECRLRYNNSKVREEHTVAWSIQRYLIAGLLTFLTDRQRTIRELKLGETLVKIEDKWFIEQDAKQYKTGKTYGERRLPIPEILYPELEAWLTKWRDCLKPSHDFVFTKKNGKALDKTATLSIFENAVFHVTGKKLNPHEVRHITVSHFRKAGASDAEMAALAFLMAHSRRAQDEDYDRRCKQERIEPVLELMFHSEVIKPALPLLEPIKLDEV